MGKTVSKISNVRNESIKTFKSSPVDDNKVQVHQVMSIKLIPNINKDTCKGIIPLQVSDYL